MRPKGVASHSITGGTVVPCAFTVSDLYMVIDAVWVLLLGHSHSPAFSFLQSCFLFLKSMGFSPAKPPQILNIAKTSEFNGSGLPEPPLVPWALTHPGQTCYSSKENDRDSLTTKIEWVLSATGPELQGCL